MTIPARRQENLTTPRPLIHPCRINPPGMERLTLRRGHRGHGSAALMAVRNPLKPKDDATLEQEIAELQVERRTFVRTRRCSSSPPSPDSAGARSSEPRVLRWVYPRTCSLHRFPHRVRRCDCNRSTKLDPGFVRPGLVRRIRCWPPDRFGQVDPELLSREILRRSLIRLQPDREFSRHPGFSARVRALLLGLLRCVVTRPPSRYPRTYSQADKNSEGEVVGSPSLPARALRGSLGRASAARP